jgi:hypothetical protein
MNLPRTGSYSFADLNCLEEWACLQLKQEVFLAQHGSEESKKRIKRLNALINDLNSVMQKEFEELEAKYEIPPHI